MTAVVLVTGTGTGVGKTIATAAMASALTQSGLAVGVVKPVQSGAGGGEPTDADVVRTLSPARTVVQLAALDDPLAPDTAARLRGLETPSVADLAAMTSAVADEVEVTLVEGAGGVLVRLDTDGGTIVDLGRRLSERGHPLTAVVVTTLLLGTLNHTELTLMALRAGGVATSGLVIGSQPPALGLAERCNLTELPRVTGLSLLGSVPSGAGGLEPAKFRALADGWLPDLRSALGPPCAQ
jgi:dethiobiotin synthetase